MCKGIDQSPADTPLGGCDRNSIRSLKKVIVVWYVRRHVREKVQSTFPFYSGENSPARPEGSTMAAAGLFCRLVIGKPRESNAPRPKFEGSYLTCCCGGCDCCISQLHSLQTCSGCFNQSNLPSVTSSTSIVTVSMPSPSSNASFGFVFFV